MPSLVKTGARPTMCHMQLIEDDVLWFTEHYTEQHIEGLVHLVAQLTTPPPDAQPPLRLGGRVPYDAYTPLDTPHNNPYDACQQAIEVCKKTPQEILESDHIPRLQHDYEVYTSRRVQLPERTKMETWHTWHITHRDFLDTKMDPQPTRTYDPVMSTYDQRFPGHAHYERRFQVKAGASVHHTDGPRTTWTRQN